MTLEEATDRNVMHGVQAGYRAGCRCERCRAANTATHARYRRERAGRIDDAPHGTNGGYDNWSCRCESCCSAHAEAMANQAQNRANRPDEIPHGTRSGYVFWRCRCDECRAATFTRAAERERALNSRSLETAAHHRQQWTGAELEVLALSDRPARELASLLGRSVIAVRTMRQRIGSDPRKARLAGIAS